SAPAVTQAGVLKVRRDAANLTAPRGTQPALRTARAGRTANDFADRETDELAPLRGWPAPRPSRRRSGASRLRHRSAGCGRPAGSEGPERVVRAGPGLLLVLHDRVPQVATRRPRLVGKQHG